MTTTAPSCPPPLPASFPVTVGVVNCGHGGLECAGDMISAFAISHHLDIIVLSETHIKAGTLPTIPYCDVMWHPRASVRDKHISGGVAFCVPTHSVTRLDAVMLCEYTCESADIIWLKYDFVRTKRPLYVCAVYLPPEDVRYVCRSPTCTFIECRKSHIDIALAHIHDTCALLSRTGDILVCGDFNAHVELQTHPRCKAITSALIHTLPHDDNSLSLANPTDLISHAYVPTHTTGSVLDIVLKSVHNHHRMGVAVHHVPVASYDHLPLIVTVDVLVDDIPPHLPSSSWVSTHPVPVGYMSAPRLPPSFSDENVQKDLATQLAKTIANCVPPILPTTQPPLLHTHATITGAGRSLETAVATTLTAGLIAVGNSRRVRGQPCPQLDAGTLALRSYERQARLLRAYRTSHDGNPSPRNSQREAVLVADLELARETMRRLRPLAHAARRQRLATQRAHTQATLDSAWTTCNARALADAHAIIKLGNVRVKHRGPAHTRNNTPHITAEMNEWAAYLAQKYSVTHRFPLHNASVHASHRLAMRTQLHDHACTQPVTLEEVSTALHHLKSQSSALGVPIKFLKLMAASPTCIATFTSLLQTMYDTGNVPEDYCLVRATLVYKSGSRADKGSYRVLGVNAAFAKLYQEVTLRRLFAVASGAISDSQRGFMPGRSTQDCIWMTSVASACDRVTGSTVYTCFADLTGAYAAVPHDVLMSTLSKAGVTGYLWRSIDSWLQQQRMFVQIGRIASQSFPVNIGLPEGAQLSPFLFLLLINPTIAAMDAIAAGGGAGNGMSCGASNPITSYWYADDGSLWARSANGLHDLLLSASEHALLIGADYNNGPQKTAIMVRLALKRSAAARDRKSLASHPPAFLISHKPISTVDYYRHLGMWVHRSGHAATVKLHVQKLMPKIAGVYRQASTAGLREVSLFHALVVYLSVWRPSVTYALVMYAQAVPLAIQRMEERVMRLMFTGVANMPLVVMRSILGLSSWHATLQLQQLWWLFDRLQHPAGTPERNLLTRLVTTWLQYKHPALWWHWITPTLLDMDRAIPASVDAAGTPGGPVLWSNLLTMAAMGDPSVSVDSVSTAKRYYKQVLLAVEATRQCLELDCVAASVGEVRDLVTGQSFHPFIAAPRCPAVQWMVLLRGGVRVAFGYQYFHTAVCPMCSTPGLFTVRHLVQDCGHFASARETAWAQARTIAVDRGIMTPGQPLHANTYLWYRLTVGASVPSSFLALDLDAPTHWARPTGSRATRHVRRNLSVYVALLRVLGAFLCVVCDSTARRLADCAATLPKTPKLNAKRAPKLRWTARQLQQHRDGQLPVPDIDPAAGDDADADGGDVPDDASVDDFLADIGGGHVGTVGFGSLDPDMLAVTADDSFGSAAAAAVDNLLAGAFDDDAAADGNRLQTSSLANCPTARD